ncbi:MAG: nucleoside monophosphate kinase [Thermoplasmata archaeon]|nr:nucleoside monophosphate kinase [Thermoplasmata archaeon]MCI4341973.1 nucleoside monophosphate kinase [Thermoplasmata archaeon]
MIHRPVALGGPPGSGKTTAARSLARKFELTLLSAGDRFRAEAANRGLSLAEFSRLAETDGSIDRSLDDSMLAEARPGVLLEGRIQGPLLRRRGTPALWVAVVASEPVRAARAAAREGTDEASALRLIRLREESERRRYKEYYGIDLAHEEAEFTVDSSELTREQVVDRLAEYLSRADGGS